MKDRHLTELEMLEMLEEYILDQKNVRKAAMLGSAIRSTDISAYKRFRRCLADFLDPRHGWGSPNAKD